MTTQTAVRIPERGRQILKQRSFGQLATLMPDGAPQVTPVWVDVDGDEILVNTAEGRLKPRNIRTDDRVAISIQDPDDPQVALIVRGQATLTSENAKEHADSLARRYTGADEFETEPGEERVVIRIVPERVLMYGA